MPITPAAYKPKPDPASYASMLAAFGVDPKRALFAEDMARNLRRAKALGMATLWVNNGSEQAGEDGVAADYIDFTTDDLGGWLAELTGVEA